MIFIYKTVIFVVACGTIIAISYSVSIIITKSIYKCSTDEAIQHIIDFFQSTGRMIESFGKKSRHVFNYDVFIGWNGFVFRDDVINTAFEDLGKHWETYYFFRVSNEFPYPSMVTYEFKVYGLKSVHKSRIRLTSAVRNIAEKALTSHLHDIGIYSAPIDRFVAVNWKSDILSIHIARNETAFEYIDRLRAISH